MGSPDFPENVIQVNFLPHVFENLNCAIHNFGVEKVHESLVIAGYRESYVKVLIRKVLKMRGGQ